VRVRVRGEGEGEGYLAADARADGGGARALVQRGVALDAGEEGELRDPLALLQVVRDEDGHRVRVEGEVQHRRLVRVRVRVRVRARARARARARVRVRVRVRVWVRVGVRAGARARARVRASAAWSASRRRGHRSGAVKWTDLKCCSGGGPCIGRPSQRRTLE